MIDPPQVRPEEPNAVTPQGGIRGVKSQRWLSYPTKLHVRICEGGVERSTPLLDPTVRQASEFRRTIGGNIADLRRVGKGGSGLPLPVKSIP